MDCNMTTLTCAKVAGVWSRLFEQDLPATDDANADTTTLVLWTQTPISGIYVDLRLPRNSPGRSDAVGARRTPRPWALRATRGSLVVRDEKDRTILLRQKSFAGVLTYRDGDASDPPGVALANDPLLAQWAADPTAALSLCTCFWRRDLDYQPPSVNPDIGVCVSYSPQMDNGTVDLRETGADGSYAEGWRRLSHTHTGPFMALQLVSENGHLRAGYWVRTGPRFACAIGRPTDAQDAVQLDCPPSSCQIKDQVGKSLAQAMEEGILPTDDEEWSDAIGSYVAVAGEIQTDTGHWKILESTNPDLVNCHLVGPDLDDETTCSILRGESDIVQEGDTVDQIVCGEGSFVRKWRVVELTACTLPFLPPKAC